MEIKQLNLKEPKKYKIDMDKVKTIEDIKVLFRGMNLIVYDNAKTFEIFKPYLKEKQ